MEQAKMIYSIVDRNRKHLLPWLQWVHYTKKPEDTLDFLKGKEKEWESKKSALYCIYIKNTIIGTVELMNINYVKDLGEVGYWIDGEYSGKGYISEATKLLENEFFNKGINKIVIKADEDNLASIGVIEKCGYTFEGCLRQDEYYREGGGEYRNIVVYSKLYHEWKAHNE